MDIYSRFSTELLLKHFGTASFKGFGVEKFEMGLLLQEQSALFKETHHNELSIFHGIPELKKKIMYGLISLPSEILN